MIHIISFYLFASILLAAAAMVIFSRNPVHSVLWLIVAFFNAAGLTVSYTHLTLPTNREV